MNSNLRNLLILFSRPPSPSSVSRSLSQSFISFRLSVRRLNCDVTLPHHIPNPDLPSLAAPAKKAIVLLEFVSHAACRAAWGIEQRQHHRRHLPPRASRASGQGAPPVGDAEVGEGRRKGREVEVCAGFRSVGLGRRRLCVVVFGPAGGSPLARTMCSVDEARGRGATRRGDEERRNGGEWVTMVVPVVI